MASPLNSSVHVTKCLITYSINGTRTHEGNWWKSISTSKSAYIKGYALN